MAVAPGSSKAVAASWVMVADPLSVMTGRKVSSTRTVLVTGSAVLPLVSVALYVRM